MNNASKLTDTDLCVMCGMCLPQCPTYQLYQNETESPRGRIALMQAIDEGRIKANTQALLHIDHCLGCLNCETICPSQVPYGKLIDEFREQHYAAIKKPLIAQAILKQAAKTNGISHFAKLANMPLVKPLLGAAAFVCRLIKCPLHIPFDRPPVKFKALYSGNYSDITQRCGEVNLFTGCSGTSLDYRAINDAINLLNQLKFDVYIEGDQSCCGALHQHNGQQKTAEQLLDHCQTALKLANKRPLLFFSPACGERLIKLNGVETYDIRHFILEQLQQQPLTFSTSSQAVALHESCSHRNRLKSASLNIELLKVIPSLQIIKSSNPSLCCGAGGIQSINYPRQAEALLRGKLDSFDFKQTNVLISDNIGCSLHIKTAVYGYNPNIEVMHPVSFLARQLNLPAELTRQNKPNEDFLNAPL